MLPGVIGDFESVETDSFYDGILGAPQYTRPPEFQGMAVPEVLRDGNHAHIARYRRKEALRVTRARRPELLKDCSENDQTLLNEIEEESGS
jgi:tRNA (guanine37-N1)-methyltransferase